MLNSGVARRYARALLGAVLEVQQEPETVATEVDTVAAQIGGFKSLESLILNPAVDAVNKTAVLEEVADHLGAGALTRRLISVLGARERLDQVQAVAAEYRRLVDARAGVGNAEVTAPAELEPGAVDDLRRSLENVTGGTIRLSTRTDPELLGGLVTRIGDQVYDGSLRHHLERLRASMIEG